MCKNKIRKNHSKIKEIEKDKLFKLYNNLPYICMSCCYNANCTEINKKTDTDDCNNYERAIELNELIKMLNKLNVNLDSFCKKYNLKKEFLIQMLKGKMLIKYRYYIAILHRVHIIDEFSEYENRFLNTKVAKTTNE